MPVDDSADIVSSGDEPRIKLNRDCPMRRRVGGFCKTFLWFCRFTPIFSADGRLDVEHGPGIAAIYPPGGG
jgi:hypothetical protein